MSAGRCEDQALQFALAARLTSYPDAQFGHWVTQLLASGAKGPHGPLLGLAQPGADLDSARSEYVALFDHGPSRTPLYETEYGRMRGMSKGPELADINGFYRAFGLGSADGDDKREMSDHVGVELEFYAVLLARQAKLHAEGDRDGVEIVEDARRKFLVDHLGRFTPALAQRENVAQSAVYGPVFAWARALVEEECRLLGVTPAALDFHHLEPAPETDELCGATDQLKQPRPPPAPGPQ